MISTDVDVDRSSASARVAVVTGANQGLGLALVAGLRSELEADATVYLTGRDAGRVEAAVASSAERASRSRASGSTCEKGQRRGVRSDDPSAARRAGHRVLDRRARISPDKTMADQVALFVDTNNRGTTRIMRWLGPLLRANGRFFVVASSFGTLRELPGALPARFDDPGLSRPASCAARGRSRGRRPVPR